MQQPAGSVPDVVRNKAIAAGASDWLATLPHLIDELAGEWGFTAGEAFPGGTESHVVEVELEDGTPAVLKLLVPHRGDAARLEIAALRLAAAEGCPEVYAADGARWAVLLERLGPSMFDLGIPICRRHELLAAAAQRFWWPVDDTRFPSGADKAQWLKDFVERSWVELEQPCSRRAVEYALVCAERRRLAHDDATAVLIHGDVHQWNALQAGDGFKLIDPDGLLAEPEYDLGIIMREDPIELLEGDPWERAHRLAALTGCDPTAAWEWGVVERVSTGLLCTEIDLQQVGRDMLAAADLIASSTSW